ncbi:PREDICTED: cocaine- and amphetamine-regulated transcript protein [Mesitornis unicolor]|uniref:cocaine- and amphetamine-regulated transcript protein n=1 Tax=Mesitornis unicolor TaxID=54374 RepID=UPI0005292A8C|nr:PREDICTED: cocaine- and amphetamine-regulated transcript protein [Mesitornis unicolor]
MGSAWLCILCLAGSGLILSSTTEPVPGLQRPQSLPGQSQEEMELCEPGEPCAVRRGARIGKLCSCPRSTTCNLFILKCS